MLNTVHNYRTLTVLAFALSRPTPPAHANAVHTPKPGTSERAAIMDGLRPSVMQRVHKKVIFKVNMLKVKDGWACFEGTTLYANGAPLGAGFLWGETSALLRRSGAHWQVMTWGFATDTGVMDRAKAKYPRAPRAIFPG